MHSHPSLKIVNHLIKSPLFQFIVIGSLLFVLYYKANPQTDNSKPNEILIKQSALNRLLDVWHKQWQRDPTEIEYKQLVETYIREELYYKEALRIGLDKNDEIVRRRLAQKMEFLLNDIATISEPTDQELNDFFQKNIKNYLTPYKISFNQYLFQNDEGQNTLELATNALKQISDKNNPILTIDALKLTSDRFPLHIENKNSDQLARIFGLNFIAQLPDMPLHQWIGPIHSGFGEHLIYITQYTPPIPYKLEEVKSQVKNDYLNHRRGTLNEQLYQNVRKKYTVIIEPNNISQAIKQTNGTINK